MWPLQCAPLQILPLITDARACMHVYASKLMFMCSICCTLQNMHYIYNMHAVLRHDKIWTISLSPYKRLLTENVYNGKAFFKYEKKGTNVARKNCAFHSYSSNMCCAVLTVLTTFIMSGLLMHALNHTLSCCVLHSQELDRKCSYKYSAICN